MFRSKRPSSGRHYKNSINEVQFSRNQARDMVSHMTYKTYVKHLTFIGPCIADIFPSISNKMHRYTIYLYLWNALHVSGGSPAHHQELKTVYTASGTCQTFTAACRNQYTSNSTRKPVPALPR
jgi:hypothetical protein